jgi:ABC-type transport system substrate-binding protein
VSPRKGGYREVASVVARDARTAWCSPSSSLSLSFPINLMMPIVEQGAGPDLRDHPVGTGPYRFVRYDVDDRLELVANQEYWAGAPKNSGLVLQDCSRRVMRGSNCRKARWTSSSTTWRRTSFTRCEATLRCRSSKDRASTIQYIGLNLQDDAAQGRAGPAGARLRHRSRRHSSNTCAAGLAVPANGMLSPLSWAAAPDVPSIPHDPARAKALLDEAGFQIRRMTVRPAGSD